MSVIRQDGFVTECVMLMFKRVALTMFVFFGVSLLLLSGCGKGDHLEVPKSRKYTIAVENQSVDPVKLRFDAYYTGYCQKGHAKEVIPSQTMRIIEVSFEGCVNGGGDSIETVVYEFGQQVSGKARPEHMAGKIVNGSKIICNAGKCQPLVVQ